MGTEIYCKKHNYTLRFKSTNDFSDTELVKMFCPHCRSDVGFNLILIALVLAILLVRIW